MSGANSGVSATVHGASWPKNHKVSGAVSSVAHAEAASGAHTQRRSAPASRGGWPASSSPPTAA